MFRNASNMVVTGGNFTSIENAGNQDAVSTTLWRHCAPGAIFDSAERYPAGRCHPGTRQRMIEKTTSWITDVDSTHHVLWLYGPAGSGKSALAHSTCELLRKVYPGRYGGSFFFSRGSTDRGKSTHLFPTLVYQLAIQFPSLRSEINDALLRDPSLPTKSIDIQFLFLVVYPILECTDWPSDPPILIIDGLDECEEDDCFHTQRNIVAIISKCLVENKVPLRFMIASRPEYWIRDTFETPPLSQISVPLSVRDDIDADKDIRLFLTENFETIRLENKRLMKSVETPWPPTHIVQRFVEEASGQYIYASTVLKFVGKSSRFTNPQEQLHIITTPGPHRASAFSELDRLYATILSAYPRRDTLKRVLGGLLTRANSTVIELVLGVDPTEYTLILDALSSLIDIKEPKALSEYELLLEPIFGSLTTGQQSVSFCHLSFREFLRDETRSGPFYVDVTKIQEEISKAFFRKIYENLDNRYDTEPHHSFGVGLTEYRRLMFHLSIDSVPNCPVKTLLALMADLNRRLQDFASVILGQVGYPACFAYDMQWVDTMLFETKTKQCYNPPGNPEIFVAIAELRETVVSAHKMGIRLLSLCSDFKITQTLVYINVFGLTEKPGLTVQKLFAMPGTSVADILDSLSQHRHVVDLFTLNCDGLPEWFIDPINLNQNSAIGRDDGWLAATEWTNHRIALTYECLKSMMQNVYNDWEHPIDELYEDVDIVQLIVGDFFDSGDLSDIRNPDYFENTFNHTILELILDSAAWTSVLPLRREPWETFKILICPALCWFNRQLTNQQTLSILEGYDVNLPRRMAVTMTDIFLHCVLTLFTTPYPSELMVSTPRGDQPSQSVKINAPQPLTQDSSGKPFFREEEQICLPPEHHNFYHIIRLDHEFFRTFRHSGELPTYSIPGILISRWHAHLADFLLNNLVKYHCSSINNGFEDDGHLASGWDFSYIYCLPYAHRGQQNLNALRALRYLQPQMTPPWHPPIGFCLSTILFLEKYESPMLSSEELDLFKSWLSELEGLETRYGWRESSLWQLELASPHCVLDTISEQSQTQAARLGLLGPPHC